MVVLDDLPAGFCVPVLGHGWDHARFERHYENEAGTITYRGLGASGEVLFLKIAKPGFEPPLRDEVERLAWARDHLPVPAVLESGRTADGCTWMVTEGLPGDDATRTPLVAQPERLVMLLALGLRRFHEAPVELCPFSFRLDAALARASERVKRGTVIPARDFHPEHAALSTTEALAVLDALRPQTEDLVVCHGDYCAPNVLIDGQEVSGYLDLGELGVADRWWDLAVATWSVGWNFGTQYEPLFLSTYGAERDEGRARFYRLLYDLVS